MTRDNMQELARESLRDRRYLEQRHNHRWHVLRRALIYVPSGALLTGLLVWALMGGYWLGIILIGIAAIAVDLEAISSLRDLPASPVTTQGRINRIWSKARFLFFGRVHYMLIGRQLFEVGPIAGLELDRGDEVLIEHWPHTNVIVTLERVKQATAAEQR